VVKDDQRMNLELVPLGTMVARLRTPIVLRGVPAGQRRIVEVDSGEITGDRLTATLEGTSAADWMTLSVDGTANLDVRAVIRTHDDARIIISYSGVADFSKGRSSEGLAPLYIVPRFETGDERYRWLNTIQAVGKGELSGATLHYELYELS
jgi:hypothetical protein